VSSTVKSNSPDGQFQVRVEAWEARMSLWVESPEICNAGTGETLLQFVSEMWSLDKANWKTNELVELTMRKYPGNHTPAQLTVVVDCRNKVAALQSLPPVELDVESRMNGYSVGAMPYCWDARS
jgi:hypothetical protein